MGQGELHGSAGPEPEPLPEPEPVPEPLPEPVVEPATDPDPTEEVDLPEDPAPSIESTLVFVPVEDPEPAPLSLPDLPIAELPGPEPLPEVEVSRLPVDAPSPSRDIVTERFEITRPSLAPVPEPVEVTVTPIAAPAPTLERLRPEPVPVEAPALDIDFGELPELTADEAPTPETPADTPAPTAPAPSPSPSPSPALSDDFLAAPTAPAPGAMQALEPAPSTGALRLYNPDGSIDLPDSLREDFAGATDDTPEFSFQQPGLLDSGSFMRRQPALVYEPTQFDEYWIPEKDILTSVLEKAVEATTGTVEIPIPGKPGSKLVCTVSILAAGGGCGIRNNNDGYVVELDDPDTLNPQEAAQCAAWWEQITSATTETAWKNTRELYDFHCRKPLAKPTEVPPPKDG